MTTTELQLQDCIDRALTVADFARLLDRLESDYRRMTGGPLERVLLLGLLLDFELAVDHSHFLVKPLKRIDS